MNRCLLVAAAVAMAAAARAETPATQPASELTAAALGKDFRPFVQKTAMGEIDWTAAKLRAVGSATAAGKAPADVAAARQAARQAAANNAVALMNSIRVGPSGYYMDIPHRPLTAQAVLADCKDVAVRFDAAKAGATAEIRAAFHGVEGIVGRRHVYSSVGPDWVSPAARAGAETVDALVVDARGSGYKPCLFPRILTWSHACCFDGIWLRRDDPSRANRPLWVVHAPSAASAAAKLAPLPATIPFGRGRKALVVRATAGADRLTGSLVLDASGTQALSRFAGVAEALALGEVVIVTDDVPWEKFVPRR